MQARAWPGQGWTSTLTLSEGKGRSRPTCEPRLGLGPGQGLLVTLMGPRKPQLALSVLSVRPSASPSLLLPQLVSTLLPGPASSWASPRGTSNRARPLTRRPTELPTCGLLNLLPAQWLIPGQASRACPHIHHLPWASPPVDILFAFEEPSEVPPPPRDLSTGPERSFLPESPPTDWAPCSLSHVV